MTLSVAERLYHDKLRKCAEYLRDKPMAGAPTELVAAQMGYHAVMSVFALAYPGLEIGDQRSQKLDTREIASSLVLLAVHLLEPMPPAMQTASFQAVTRGMVKAFGQDPAHPLHKVYLKHFGAKPDAPADQN